MKITPLPDTRIRGGYAVIHLLAVTGVEIEGITGFVDTLFGPTQQSWYFDGMHAKAETADDARNLLLTEEHQRLIAAAKGGAHE